MRRRGLIYLIIIIATFCIILYLRNPQVLKDIWLWVVGLIGVIAAYVDTLWKSLKANFFPGTAETKNNTAQPTTGIRPKASPIVSTTSKVLSGVQTPNDPAITTGDPAITQQVTMLENKALEKDKYIETLETKIATFEKSQRLNDVETFSGTTLTLLRYIDDGETTLGLLYLDGKFYCYTLEDTFRTEKIADKTRIPAGTYAILFNKALTELTQKYRAKAYTRGWFIWHLHLQNVPGFQGIYIHPGKNNEWTKGCILVSDDLHSEGGRKKLLNPENAFERLYRRLAPDLDSAIPVRIQIQDEQWFKNEIQTPII